MAKLRLMRAGLAAVTVAAAVGAIPLAHADGWYASLGAGVNLYPDSDVDSASFGAVRVEHSLDTGPVVSGALGKQLSSGVRIEGELSYRKNDYDDITVSVPATIFGTALTATTALTGDTTTLGFMANVAYDFNKGEKLRPFVMAGLGGARISINDATALSALLADDSDTVFALQAGAGINYQVTEKMSAGISYRLFGTTDPGLTAVDGTNFEVDTLNHSVLAGLTYRF